MRVLFLLLALTAVTYATVTAQELEAARVNCSNECRHNGQIVVRCMQACWARFFKDRHGTRSTTVRKPRVLEMESGSPATNFRKLLEARRRVRADKEAEMILEKALHAVSARGAPPVTTAPSMAAALTIGVVSVLVLLL